MRGLQSQDTSARNQHTSPRVTYYSYSVDLILRLIIYCKIAYAGMTVVFKPRYYHFRNTSSSAVGTSRASRPTRRTGTPRQCSLADLSVKLLWAPSSARDVSGHRVGLMYRSAYTASWHVHVSEETRCINGDTSQLLSVRVWTSAS